MKIKMPVCLAAMLIFICDVPAAAVKSVPAAAFLEMTRERAALQDSFADLHGVVTHKRRNQGVSNSYPIRFVIRFEKENVYAQLFIGKNEKYTLQRNMRLRKTNYTSSVGDNGILSSLGFKVGDLAMDFLDYPVHSELKSEKLKTLNCRVLLLNSPENKPVKVWISSEFLFPMRAEFYDSINDITEKPLRTLEITGFKKVNDYYVATDIALLAQDFRSRINFTNCRAMRADDKHAAWDFKTNSN